MTNKFRTLALLALLAPLGLFAPLAALAQEGSYRHADATQLWRLSGNAAGLALDSSANRGYAQFELQHREGDYHRVQEGGQRNQLQFYTERYQQIKPLLVSYGSFRFNMDHTKGRAWCDVMRPYNSNSFFSGSSVSGKYDTQQFDLTAAVGTRQMWGFTGGLRLDYSVGDLSRLRDPRSRSELLDYKLAPSLTYSTGSHTVGIAGHYNRRKEKIPSMTTVQQDPDLKYYLMTGMEQATGTTGGYSGYNREWVDHRFGAELTYGYNNGALKSLSSVTIERGSEDVLGTYKYEPGHYMSYRYGLTSHNRIDLHQIDFAVGYEQAYADEYRQQLVQERNAEKGYTSYWYETLITFKKRYQVKQLNAELHYRYNMYLHIGCTPDSYFGIKAALNQAENKHLLPTSSLEYTHLDLTGEGGTSLLFEHLWIDAKAGYHIASKADLQLADATTDYAIQVLLPDMQYYDANYWRGHLSLTYQFPLSLKGKRTTAFVRAYGDYLSADHGLNGSTVGLSFGLFN